MFDEFTVLQVLQSLVLSGKILGGGLEATLPGFNVVSSIVLPRFVRLPARKAKMARNPKKIAILIPKRM